ncbi:hypothetical protein BpHYR1_046127 [Brachionus plicatilis]|uniref:Uncharacterized protein n=1 Tax=Brachionus plicatilis TaxID=10195 RepID=A0A3M7PVS1_BRAPC|nr:hypothetical protein BpHYR1_046127 [Brachionus plicatilis]
MRLQINIRYSQFVSMDVFFCLVRDSVGLKCHEKKTNQQKEVKPSLDTSPQNTLDLQLKRTF